MAAHYGYFRGTCGSDGDALDVFVGPNRNSELVFVVDQSGKDGKRFDEHKGALGVQLASSSDRSYRASYKPGWHVGPVTAMTIAQFRAWLRGGNQTKPIAKQVSRYTWDLN